MKKLASLILVLLVGNFVLAQELASYDGIYMKPSPINEETFYYGEPIYLHFNVTNQKNASNSYYVPQTFTNTQVNIRNRETGQLLLEDGWQQVSHRRSEWQNNLPSEQYAFQPNESLIFQIYVNDQFGLVRLATPEYYNALANRLRVLPIGKYELIFKYFLFPSSQVLVSRKNFEVVAVPTAQQEAFQQFIKTTTYACNAHYYGGENYSQSHPDSYENFLQKYDKSTYSQYAFVDMVTQIYLYRGLPEALQNEKFRIYYDYFPQIDNGNLKLYYAAYLPMIVERVPGWNIRDKLDHFLKDQLIRQHPDISQALIAAAKFYPRVKVEGLTNYAKVSVPR